MALGDVTTLGAGHVKAIEFLAASTAANGVPSGASAGISVDQLISLFGVVPQSAVLQIVSTAGSGVMTAVFRLWGRAVNGTWVPLGPGTDDTTKGRINLETAVDETTADALVHSETIINFVGFSRLYLELVSIGGTSTSVTAWLAVSRPN